MTRNSLDDGHGCTAISSDESYEDDFDDESSSSESKTPTAPSSSSASRHSSWEVVDFDKDIVLGRRIGGGGTGIVFRGWYKQQEVAIKTYFNPKVTAEVHSAFMNELKIMSRLDHPNIVKFIGSATIPPNLCFVMELVNIAFLMSSTSKKKELSEKDRLQICLEIACGMKYLHTRTPPVIHRDLKRKWGTPNYLAPELWNGARGCVITHTVDVYSYSLLVWEVFTNVIPFYGCDCSDVRRRVCCGERPREGEGLVPKEVGILVKRGWNEDPMRRPSFGMLEEAFEGLVENCCCGEGYQGDNVQSVSDLGVQGDSLDDIMNALVI
eukprot:CAMPEP_0172524836 /NCGR_PEP_ID=MMETSP1066-20121228/294399_1 /TAXON_ID=671091 /ORGANISM="Coscinodiscus wailesii, Strain CCMP2513" /LENGTH=323 /DNA_ID=CAMNT_0013307989 /DNA_START=132 /DNA_END=1104 /DNA_ORIENTATION=+